MSGLMFTSLFFLGVTAAILTGGSNHKDAFVIFMGGYLAGWFFIRFIQEVNG